MRPIRSVPRSASRVTAIMLGVALVLVGCRGDDDLAGIGATPAPEATTAPVATEGTPRSDGSDSTMGDTTRVPDTAGTTIARPPARVPLAGFAETKVAITDAAGAVAEWCLLLADTPERRAKGLMEVTDPRLGGYDGMLFRFGGPTTSSFYMLRTRLPLSIAFYDGAGFVSSADMTPCPDDDDDPACPRYQAAAPYTDAIEVPAGNLERLGIGPASRLAVGGACPPPAAG